MQLSSLWFFVFLFLDNQQLEHNALCSILTKNSKMGKKYLAYSVKSIKRTAKWRTGCVCVCVGEREKNQDTRAIDKERYCYVKIKTCIED